MDNKQAIIKKSAFISLIFGVTLIITSLAAAFLISLTDNSNSAQFFYILSNSCNGLFSLSLFVGIALSVTAVLSLVGKGVLSQYGSRKLIIYSLSLSFLIGLGLYCFTVWSIVGAYGNVTDVPIEFLACKYIGFFAALGILIILFLYISERRKNFSTQATLLDVCIILINFLPFAQIISFISRVVGSI